MHYFCTMYYIVLIIESLSIYIYIYILVFNFRKDIMINHWHDLVLFVVPFVSCMIGAGMGLLGGPRVFTIARIRL